MRYKVPFNDLATGSSADTYKTIASIIAANTTGYRGRLVSIVIDGSDDVPVDEYASLKISRTSNATAGTAGSSIAAADIPKADPSSRDTIMTAGLNYSAEPTTYDTNPAFQTDFNLRQGFAWRWPDPDQMIKWGKNQTLGLLVAPRTANARKVSGTLEFEEY